MSERLRPQQICFATGGCHLNPMIHGAGKSAPRGGSGPLEPKGELGESNSRPGECDSDG
jgi:hypothetical protein